MNTPYRAGWLLVVTLASFVGSVFAAPPVINNPATTTITFDRDAHETSRPVTIDAPGATQITFSAFTASYSASGISEPFYSSQYKMLWFPTSPASWRFTIIASNADGETRKEVTVNVWPEESIFSVTSGHGVFLPGSVIRVFVTYYLPVTITGGTPYFGLTLNGRPMQAPYASGNGTDSLIFEFPVR